MDPRDGYIDEDSPHQRAAYADKVIDEEVAHRKVSALFRRAASRPSISDSREAMVQWAISQPSVTRAKMAEFGVAWTSRMRGRPMQAGL